MDFLIFLVQPEAMLADGLETSGQRANFGIFLEVFEFLRFGCFFCFSKKFGFGVFLVQQNMVETTLPDGLETSG